MKKLQTQSPVSIINTGAPLPVFKCGRLSGLDFVCNLMNVRGDIIRSFEGVNWRKAMTWELRDAEAELQAVRVQCTLIERQIRELREGRGP